MREETVKLYTVDELPEDVRQKVITENRGINTFGMDWWDNVYESFIEDVKNVYGVEIPYDNICFSGFGSQGDGACFEIDFTRAELVSLMNALGVEFKHKALLDIFLDSLYRAEIKKCRNYCYSSAYVDWSGNTGGWSERAHPAIADYIGEKAEELEKALDDWQKELCRELYKKLWDECDSLESDEAVEEALMDLEIEFFEDGREYKGE